MDNPWPDSQCGVELADDVKACTVLYLKIDKSETSPACNPELGCLLFDPRRAEERAARGITRWKRTREVDK